MKNLRYLGMSLIGWGLAFDIHSLISGGAGIFFGMYIASLVWGDK